MHPPTCARRPLAGSHTAGPLVLPGLPAPMGPSTHAGEPGARKPALLVLATILLLLVGRTGHAVDLMGGDIVVVDTFADELIRVDPLTGAQMVISAGDLFARPVAVAIDTDHEIFVVDGQRFSSPNGGTGVIQVDPASGDQFAVSFAGNFLNAHDIDIDGAGDLVVADFSGPSGSGGIIRVDPSDGSQTVLLVGSTPFQLAVEASGDIVATNSNTFGSRLFRVDPALGLATTLNPDVGLPVGVAVEADGSILLADTGGAGGAGPNIRRIDPMTGSSTTLSSGNLLEFMGGIAVADDGSIYVTTRRQDRTDAVVRVDPTSGAQELVSSFPGGSFSRLAGIAVVPGLPAISVGVDIKPGRGLSLVNPWRRGVVPVAVFGSNGFDVSSIDPSTIGFGPDAAGLAHGGGPHGADLNGDGIEDALMHFRVRKTGIAIGDTEACVTGALVDGTPFEGCDGIRTVPACGIGFELALLLPPLLWLWRRRNEAPGSWLRSCRSSSDRAPAGT